jgi:serpin B
MAMVLAGARDDNAAEMAKVLGQKLPGDEINAANAAVLASLNGAAPASFQLRVANALMLTKPGNAISESYIAVLREKYAAEIFQGADLAMVNGWVKEKTNGKIGSILDQLDAMTMLVLLDAIYFKARWQATFDADATRDEAFHLADGEAQVPTMHLRADFALATRPGYQAIRLPYEGGRVSMVIVLPDPGNTAIAQRLDNEEMGSLFAALRIPPRHVELALPRYHATFKSSLVGIFKSMGMRRAFDFKTADFSGMTGKAQAELPLAIGQIMHAAVIEVAEEGTEAAAATAATMVAKARLRCSASTGRSCSPSSTRRQGPCCSREGSPTLVKRPDGQRDAAAAFHHGQCRRPGLPASRAWRAKSHRGPRCAPPRERLLS